MENISSRNVLHFLAGAPSPGAYATVENLLASGRCYVNERAKDGITPLHIAAATDNFPICQLLLSFGADPLLPDEKGRFVQSTL